jgi:hypothetical protein
MGASHIPSPHRIPTRHGVLTVQGSPTLPPTIAGPGGDVDPPPSSLLLALMPRPKFPHASGQANTSRTKARETGLMKAQDMRQRRAADAYFYEDEFAFVFALLRAGS